LVASLGLLARPDLASCTPLAKLGLATRIGWPRLSAQIGWLRMARLGLAQAHEGVWLMSQPLDFHVTTVASSLGYTAPTYRPGHRHRWHHVASSAHHSSAQQQGEQRA